MNKICLLLALSLFPLLSKALDAPSALVPNGLSPGDTFFVVYASSETRNFCHATGATTTGSSPITDAAGTPATMDQFAIDSAASGSLTSGVTGWKALYVHQQVHFNGVVLDTPTGVTSNIGAETAFQNNISSPIYNLEGELVANNRADLFDGSIENAIKYDENGDAISGFAFTGFDEFGNGANNDPSAPTPLYTLGHGGTGCAVGRTTSTNKGWAALGNSNNSRSIYIISPVLTVPLPTPAITSATYDASTGSLIVTGTNFQANAGAANDVDVSLLTITGQAGRTHTLSTSFDVEITAATQFTVTISGADKVAVDRLLNANGTQSSDTSTYNLAAADNWLPGAPAAQNIADTTGNVITVSNVDSTAPVDYTIGIDQSPINSLNANTASFTFSGAEIGATYNYSVTSSGGAGSVTGSGTITTTTDQITGIDVSSLADGTVTFSVALTDTVGNIGLTATDTVAKDTQAPAFSFIAIDGGRINVSNETNLSFSYIGAEVGATYNYTFENTSIIGPTVTGSGLITSESGQITGIDVSSLADGGVNLWVTLTDTSGNVGAAKGSSENKDTVLPTGYSVSIDQSLINSGNEALSSFTFSGAEVGTTYNYNFTSNGGAESVTGNGTIATATDQITGIDLSGLPDGTVTLSVTLTDRGRNTGTASRDTVTKETQAPTGYTVIIDQSPINTLNVNAASFTFSGAEIGATYNYSLTSSGGVGSVNGSGTIATATDQVTGIDVSGLADGTISLNVTLTDSNGNTGTSATDTKTKNTETVAPSVTSITRQSPTNEFTNSDSLQWVVTFSESVQNVDGTDFSVLGGATVTSGSGASYIVSAKGAAIINANTNVTLTVSGANNITDLAGNDLISAPPTGLNQNNFVVDNTAPTVSSVAASDVNANLGESSYSFTVTYADATNDVIDFEGGTATLEDVTVTGPGIIGDLAIIAVNATPAPSGSPQIARYTLTPPGGTWDSADKGNYTISVNAREVEDLAGNFVSASESVGSFEVTFNSTPIISEGEGTTLIIDLDNPAPFAVNLSASDADAGDTLTWRVSTAPSAGSALVSSENTGTTQTISYSNGANFSGEDSFVVTVSDGTASDMITVTILSAAQNALNGIADLVDNPSSNEPTLDDYLQAGIYDVTEGNVLKLINNAVGTQTERTAVDSVDELQALVNAILEGQDGDGDGMPNLFEGDNTVDTDGDGEPDRNDIDSDQDGIADRIENGFELIDSDEDGIIDIFDADVGNDAQVDAGKVDSNFDGVNDDFAKLADLLEVLAEDADSDGIPDAYDADTSPAPLASADSVLISAAANTQDANSNGVDDRLEAEYSHFQHFSTLNEDGDNRANHLDLDSDNDGISDVLEAGLVDLNNDGLLDEGESVVEELSELPDTDNNGRPNFRQLKSDGQNNDLLSSGLDTTLVDKNNDGRIDDQSDSDNDGIADALDLFEGYGNEQPPVAPSRSGGGAISPSSLGFMLMMLTWLRLWQRYQLPHQKQTRTGRQ